MPAERGPSGTGGTAERVRYTGPFDVFAECECGYFERLPFGNFAHVHKTVCPECGASTGRWKKVRGRPARVGGGFLRLGKLVLIPKEANRAR